VTFTTRSCVTNPAALKRSVYWPTSRLTIRK